MPSSTLLVVCGDAKRRQTFVSALLEAGWPIVLSAGSMSDAATLCGPAALGWASFTAGGGCATMCVIIDAEVADMSGLKAAQIVRNLCPHVKIIFAAPENSLELEAEVRALDVFYYYISSADKAELVAAVTDAIGAPRPDRLRHCPKVLIVDDDRDFHVFVQAVLEPAGYIIVSAYSEREGLDLARRARPDAILLDIMMNSTTDGFVFCREARHDPQIKHIPILGVSAIEQRTGQKFSADLDGDLFPVDGYLRKPVVLDRLFAELKRLVPAEG